MMGYATSMRFALATFLALAGLGIFSTGQARAADEFKNGFEDQLGRIAAVEAVRFGKFVLSGGVHAGYGYAAYERRPARWYRPPRPVRWQRPPRPARWQRVERYYYDEPCDEGRVVYERYERRRRGGRTTERRVRRYY